MLLQNTLDLSTFEIVRFRIWNQTSQPSDRGFGSKYFNTNSGHEAYCREEIFTPSGWRTAAYLDDIEAITNGEGSLGTRVKALEDMLNVDSAETVVSTWAEIQAFLDQVQEGTDLMTMLDGKAEWNKDIPSDGFKTIGYGTIGTKGWRFNGPALSFGANSTYYAQLQINFQADQIVFRRHTNQGFSEWQTLLHSGNVGDFAALKDGSNAEGRWENGAEWLETNNRTPTTSLNELVSASNAHKMLYYMGWAPSDAPEIEDWANALLHINRHNSGGASQLLFNSKGKIFYRATHPSAVSDSEWKTIAFTDSTVAAAYKLKNPSTNADVVTITEEGNVLVGVASQTNTDFKFEVSGLSRIYTVGQSMSLGKVPTSGLVLGSSLGLQGQFYFDYSGNICLQGQSVSDSTTRALNLNPLGGAVNIASADAPTNVFGELKVGSGTMGYINLVGSGVNYLWAANTTHIGLSTVGGRSGDNATLSIKGDSIHSGFRNNAVSLGTSSYRWSNVYSVGGNFSGRVLIGGAEDDENYKLITNGAVKIARSKDAGTYLGITVSDILTTFDANDNSDNYMRYSFQSHGTELLRLDGKAGGTSYFRTLVGFDKEASFYGGALIPAGQSLTIGSVTIKEVATGEIEVNGNLHTTGTLASGGKATVGEGDNGGGGNANVYSDVLEGVITQEWEVGNPFQKEDVIVSLYMWNTNESRWEMVLADIGVTSENIWVTFGRPTSTTDKYMAVVMG